MNKSKILLFDIETAPNLGYIWGKYEQDVVAYEQESYMLCFAAKWLGSKSFAYSLPDFKGYKPGQPNDKELIKKLWELFDEADVLIAHNGNRFDIKKANARFLFHKLPPPSPYKTVDTKVAAKSVAMFNSNKLDDLGELLSEGRKIKTDFSLWQGCMTGDKQAWNRMVRYNIQDVQLLERIYLRLLPWIKNHPNMASATGICPKCRSTKLQLRGFAVTQGGRYHRFQCQDCGGWGRLPHRDSKINTYKPI